MPVSRIVYEFVPVGTILRDGSIVRVVDSVTQIDDFGIGRHQRAPSWNKTKQWKLRFRAATEEEKVLSEIMQT